MNIGFFKKSTFMWKWQTAATAPADSAYWNKQQITIYWCVEYDKRKKKKVTSSWPTWSEISIYEKYSVKEIRVK